MLIERFPCLLLHGFTGGPFEVEPLADYLRHQGWECFVPTLPGHGGDLSRLRGVKWGEWLDCAVMEAERLTVQYGGFNLVGFSMGGLISAYLANRYPVKRLVLLSTAVVFFSPGRLAKDIRYRIRQRDWKTFRKKNITPISSALQFLKLALNLIPQVSQIRVPTLIVQGQMDEVVHPVSAAYIYRNVQGEKELHYLPRSKHIVCLGEETGELFGRVGSFLKME